MLAEPMRGKTEGRRVEIKGDARERIVYRSGWARNRERRMLVVVIVERDQSLRDC
jgi:hypothetical protein